MKTKLIALLSAILTLMSFTASAQDIQDITVEVNGEICEFDVAAQIINNRTMVPMRAIFEKLGAFVDWNDETKTVVSQKDDITVKLSIGSSKAYVNNEEKILDAPGVIIDSRTLVPARFVSEAFGAFVDWDDKNRKVTISSDAAKPYAIAEISAIGDDGNIPQYAIDGDYNTRWSFESKAGAWLLMDLGETKPLGYMGVAYYCGDERMSVFDIEVSEDNINYTNIVKSKAGELTLDMTPVNLGGVNARYVKYIGYGNSDNSWNSITEIAVYPPREDGQMILTGGKSNAAGTVTDKVVPADIRDALEEMRAIYDDKMIEYLASMYDPENGAFYYAVSARDNEGFLPDVESTGQIEAFLETLLPKGQALKNFFPADMQKKMIEFVQNMQSPDDGYFYHKQWGKEIGESRRGRDLGWATTILSRFDAKPLYPTALERLASGTAKTAVADNSSDGLPEHLKSKEAFLDWIAALPWSTNSYYAANMLNATVKQIQAAGLSQTAVDYLRGIQNKETGFWGEGKTYTTASAVMKLGAIYSSANAEFDYPELILRSLIDVALSEEKPGAIVYIYNPWSAISSLRSQFLSGTPDWFYEVLYKNAPLMILKTRDKLLAFKKPDGGFSYNPAGSSPTSQGASASLGLAESDVNATCIGINGTLRTIYGALGIPYVPAFDESDFHNFVELIKAAKPIVKKEQQIGAFLDFESLPLNEAPTHENLPGHGVTLNGGSVIAVKDPTFGKNKAIAFTTVKGSNENFFIKLYDGKQGKPVTLEFKVMFAENTNKTFLFTISAGMNPAAYQLIVKRPGDVLSVGDRRYSSGENEMEFYKSIAINEWYGFKIIYTPGTSESVNIKLYIDDVLVNESKKYYFGKGPGEPSEPKSSIDAISFTSLSDAVGTMYIDDIKMSVSD